ncbi:hypothetical protein C8R43DRAFT_676402 [Mycena crocata]|nr:hypothetical protein C8R43DRAFT_676402 [Mycena crocata]
MLFALIWLFCGMVYVGCSKTVRLFFCVEKDATGPLKIHQNVRFRVGQKMDFLGRKLRFWLDKNWTFGLSFVKILSPKSHLVGLFMAQKQEIHRNQRKTPPKTDETLVRLKSEQFRRRGS